MNQEASPSAPVSYPAVDRSAPQLTIRAILTGMLLGGVLSLCNIYSGLKIGWGFNMSVTAALLSFGFWGLSEKVAGTRRWGLLENNINQTTASSAASISSAGLVAPIPALTILTGQQFTWGMLAIWTLSVSLVGVVVAIGLRRQMLLIDALPFPNGIATGETVKEMYAKGSEAMARVKMLLAGSLLGASAKLTIALAKLKSLALPGAFAGKGAMAGKILSLKNLTLALDPSPLMVAVGAIIGVRAGISLMIGALIAWGWLGPHALAMGWAQPGDEGAMVSWYGSMNKWMLWPGVSMMVTASLTSFAFSWRSIVAAMRGSGQGAKVAEIERTQEVPRRFFLVGLVGALVVASFCQTLFFGIGLGTAILAVLLTFVLAIVAARVSGETGITPVGAMGKVTQLTFGVIAPGSISANLMTANVTGGAASQCADLLHDMKTGLMIGASPRLQALAQVFGVLAGALVGSAGYLLLVPDPAGMLMTEEWAAPAVAAWKGVAEILTQGLDAMPPMALWALAIAGLVGMILAILEKILPKERARWVPSPASVGLAMVIPGTYSISMFIGGVLGWGAMRWMKGWASRFLIVLAAGVIAGESLAGVGLAIQDALAYVAAGGAP
ncbi:MAG: OPT/YSL family transporter [Myxococcales bacterium]|nr:OPT/YSL family transporter [Myxococcales bacterium]